MLWYLYSYLIHASVLFANWNFIIFLLVYKIVLSGVFINQLHLSQKT